MKRAFGVLAVLALLLGCSPLVPVYAPRRDNTDFHREATSKEDCLGCHDVSKIRKHDPKLDCLRCHRINGMY